VKQLLAFLILSFSVAVYAGQSETLSAISQLESQFSGKVKDIVLPADPDAIIFTRIKIKEVETNLPGMEFSGFSLMATEDVSKISATDIESISVNVLTALDEFPKDLYQVVNQAIRSSSEKARLTVKKVDAKTLAAIRAKKVETQKNKEQEMAHLEKISKLDETFTDKFSQKIEGYGPAIYQILQMGLGILVGGFAVIMLIMTLLKGRSQAKAMRLLAQSISEIKMSGDLSGGAMAAGVGASSSSEEKSDEGGKSVANKAVDFIPETSLFESMSLDSLRALFSDAYWCGHDKYASYLWKQLTNQKQKALFESWHGFESYVVYLNRVPAVVEWYHLDPHYLKPLGYHDISNEDMLRIVRVNKAAWGSLSIMRRQAMDISLEERMKLLSYAQSRYVVGWPDIKSELRKFPAHLEITSLSEQDEAALLVNPDLLPHELREQLPTLNWIYFCRPSERERILSTVPAQALAEVWVAPPEVLEAMMLAIPEKKQELLKDYQKTIKPIRSSKWIKIISDAALASMANAEAELAAEVQQFVAAEVLEEVKAEIEGITVPGEESMSSGAVGDSDANQVAATASDELGDQVEDQGEKPPTDEDGSENPAA
jgi:hypothetical protein